MEVWTPFCMVRICLILTLHSNSFGRSQIEGNYEMNNF